MITAIIIVTFCKFPFLKPATPPPTPVLGIWATFQLFYRTFMICFAEKCCATYCTQKWQPRRGSQAKCTPDAGSSMAAAEAVGRVSAEPCTISATTSAVACSTRLLNSDVMLIQNISICKDINSFYLYAFIIVVHKAVIA